MSAKFDSEDLIQMLEDIMKHSTEGLNTYITNIEAEKTTAGKGLTPALKTVPATAYYPQTWNDKILNNPISVFYGIEDVATVDGGGAVAKTYKLFCEIVLCDNNLSNDSWKRVSRYSRALEELFAKKFDPAIAGGRVKVEQVRPIAFKLALDSDDEVKVGGVSLTITLV